MDTEYSLLEDVTPELDRKKLEELDSIKEYKILQFDAAAERYLAEDTPLDMVYFCIVEAGRMKYHDGYSGQVIKVGDGVNGINALMDIYVREYAFKYRDCSSYYIVYTEEKDPRVLTANVIMSHYKDRVCRFDTLFHTQAPIQCRGIVDCLLENRRRKFQQVIEVGSMKIEQLEEESGIKIEHRTGFGKKVVFKTAHFRDMEAVLRAKL